MTATRTTDKAPLPTAFWYLFAGMIINRLGTFVLPYLALYLSDAGYRPAVIGLVVAAYGVGSVLSSLIGGVLADRWGRLPTMVLGLLLAALLAALLGFVSSAPAIALVAFALGLGGDIYRPAANAAVADLVPAEGRVRAFGLLYWAGNLGFSGAAIMGGLIANRSFVALFLVDAATSLACAVVLGYGLRGLTALTAAKHGTSSAGRLVDVVGDRVFIAFAVLSFAFMWIFYQASVPLPVSLADAGLDPSRYGLVMAVNGVTVVLLQSPVNWVARRLDPAHALAAMGVLMGGGFGMLAWVQGLPLFFTAVVIWTIGEIVYGAVAPAVVADLSPERLRGRYQGVFSATSGVAAFAGPAMGGVLLDRFGTAGPWLTCLALGLAISAGHLALTGAYRRATAARAQPQPEPEPLAAAG